MNKFLLLLLPIILSCKSNISPIDYSFIQSPEQLNQNIINNIQNSTVVLTQETSDNPNSTLCTAFFISPTLILTANHCIQLYQNLNNISKSYNLPITFKVNFFYYSEFISINQQPSSLHHATIVKSNPLHDLALLQTEPTEFSNYFIPISQQIPQIGIHIRTIGHPKGFNFSYQEGIISQIRLNESFQIYSNNNTLTLSGNFIQISSPIFPGNSGSPLTNQSGYLIGLISFTPQLPNTAFAIHLADINNLLSN